MEYNMIGFLFFSEHSSCDKGGDVLEDNGLMRNQRKTSQIMMTWVMQGRERKYCDVMRATRT